MGGKRTRPRGSTDTAARVRIFLPHEFTTGMTAWRFKGADRSKRRKIRIVPNARPGNYFVGAAGVAAGAGAGVAGAAAAFPAVAAGAGVAAAAAWGCEPGLIQQAWIRLDRVSATLGSIWPPKLVKKRKADWT